MRGKEYHELIEKAAECVQKEKFDGAIAIYRQLLAADPEDMGLRLKLANIHQIIGQESLAIKIYMSVLLFYQKKNQYQQAIAVCRLILAIDPLHIRAQQILMEMYIKVYGSLPAKTGETIMPAGAAASTSLYDEDLSMRWRAADTTGVELAHDSWNPVDIVFSHEDAIEMDFAASEDGALEELAVDITAEIESIAADSADVDVDVDAEEGGQDATDTAEMIASVELPDVPLFYGIGQEEWAKVVQQSKVVQFAPTDFILKEGEVGDSFFAIIKGCVQILKGESMKPVVRLGAGACFGEMALFGPRARRVSVVAIESTTLLEIDRSILKSLQRRFPGFRRAVRRNVRERLLDNSLATNPLFSPFSKEVHDSLRARFTSQEFIPYEIVIHRGEDVENLYLIVDGRAEILLETKEGRRHLIATLGMGEVFGETSLLIDSPSKVTIRAKGRLSTLCLPKDEFKSLVAQHPDIQHLIAEILESESDMPRPL